MTGRPIHFKTKNRDWTACGKQSDLAAWDYRHVTCLLCRKTRAWKACTTGDMQAFANSKQVTP